MVSKKFFEEENFKLMGLTKTLLYDYYKKKRCDTIDIFLLENKDDLIFLFKTYEKSNIKLKKRAYATIAAENILKKNSFVIGQYGYGINGSYMDILVKPSEMEKIVNVLKRYGYKIKEEDFVWFDMDDFKFFFEYQKKGLKSGKALEHSNFSLPRNKYQSPLFNVYCKNNDLIMKEYRDNNVKRKNEHELIMCRLLEEIGVDYKYQQIISIKCKSYIMDIFIPDKYICIEIDGGYHEEEQQIKKDLYRTNELSKFGILTIRYTNYELDTKYDDIKKELSLIIKGAIG